jgi:hypothetical protein
MVIYRGADGKPGYHQAEALNDAVRFVEGLRNDEGVEHARIFRLDEVTFEFRPYFRVEIGDETPAPVDASAAAAVATAVAAEPVADEPVADATPVEDPWPEDEQLTPEPAGNGASVGRRGLFGR